MLHPCDQHGYHRYGNARPRATVLTAQPVATCTGTGTPVMEAPELHWRLHRGHVEETVRTSPREVLQRLKLYWK